MGRNSDFSFCCPENKRRVCKIVLAKNGSQRTLLNRITAVQDGRHLSLVTLGASRVACLLSIQERNRPPSTADFQDPGKGPTLHRIEVGALLGRLTHEDGEVVRASCN